MGHHYHFTICVFGRQVQDQVRLESNQDPAIIVSKIVSLFEQTYNSYL